ncbi:HAMP domain-containing protein [Gemella sp. 19428wG2_WT2a]|nr:HAMP domain-containing protein [Gemella sp. 19428wG2_WT2a]TFU58813.1 cell wall metabolism sensor histidine kinase WalK [Gemella sp. WT2a]
MKFPFKKTRRWFSSIRFKFVIVYVLVNIISLQLIGLYFTTQFKAKNISKFQTTIIEQEKKLNYNIMEEMVKLSSDMENNKAIESNINKTVSEFSSNDLVLLNVIDSSMQIIASANTNSSESYVGKRSVDPIVEEAMRSGQSIGKNQTDESGRIYWTYANPIKADNRIIGVIYIMSDMANVYSDSNEVTKIFIYATSLSILIVTFIGLFAAKTITKSIERMSNQVRKMSEGNYEEIQGVTSKDEIGDLAVAFNQMSNKIKEEQLITESERRKLSTIINSMKDGIISTDSSGRIILINDSAKEMLNKEEDFIYIGEHALDILNINEYRSIRSILEAEDSMVISIGQDEEELLYRLEFTEVISDGLDDYYGVTKLDGYIIVIYDVTENERQEKERREFVSTVSHELRTPLTTMNSYVEALEEGVLDDKELAPVFINTIHKETNRMIRMVNELLQLGKIDIKEEHFDKDLFDINKLMERIVERFQLTHTDKNFILHLPDEAIFVDGDHDKITQVFDNIINNAVKYSPYGKNITVRVRQNYNHNRVSISIKDEGIGIPITHIDKIFNRFYRVDKSRQRTMGGTGLGLALAKSIVEGHKGKIWAQSREGYGTIIFVMLPSEKLYDEWE